MVTVTSENYVQWTMTMVYSFIKSNDWFTGDIILICNHLPEEFKQRFAVFRNVRFVQPTDLLLYKIEDLCAHIPAFTRMASMFYSLETFNLTGYDKVLFLDSDMLVVKPVEDVFETQESFLASAESCWYFGKGRRSDTYESVEKWSSPDLFLKNPVNSGFMVIDKQHISEANYNALIEMISPELWANKNTFHADQLIINLFFKDQITLCDASYNYRPTLANEIRAKDKLGLEEAKIIHFYRQYKPWNFTEVLSLSQHDMVHIKAFGMWYSYYTDFLKYYHLQLKIQQLQHNGTTHP
jgi:lipopolysaccharide biosynthesis glycosyltransferase